MPQPPTPSRPSTHQDVGWWAVDTPPLSPGEKVYRWTECLALFGVLPALLALALNQPDAAEVLKSPGGLALMLYSALAVTLTILLRDRTFPRRSLWNAWQPLRDGTARPGLLAIRLLAGGVAIAAFVLATRPENFLGFPRNFPERYALVVTFYPILSVYAQGIIYRLFFFHRYGSLFRSPEAMIGANALFFAWSHVVFHSWLALVMTLLGGLFFAQTYARTRSAAWSWLEHSLFGIMVFTLGLGRELYLGGR